MLTVHQRYRQTKRQTDGRTTYDSNTALVLRALRGKTAYWRLSCSECPLSLSVSFEASVNVSNFTVFRRHSRR